MVIPRILIALGATVLGLLGVLHLVYCAARVLGSDVAGSAAYLALAKRYWFRTPLVGVAIATVCFLIAACVLSF